MVGATLDQSGNYVGGTIQVPRATEIAGFSPVQYIGNTQSQDREYIYNGKSVNYHEFVRLSLSKEPLRINPPLEISRLVDSLCYALQDRVLAVNHAIRVGMHKDPHPNRLPPNIYGTGGNVLWNIWEKIFLMIISFVMVW